ncbi:MAG: glycerophosphoryl diester phosphodiesterase [Verrucomicrobia bacterium]|nr:glycerophosphoryl diester phosphodiesterase [Verrucomicrobiota bacterium]
MSTSFRRLLVSPLTLLLPAALAFGAESVQLANERVKLVWQREADGWHVRELAARGPGGWVPFAHPSGRHTIVHIDRRPAGKLVEVQKEGTAWPYFPGELSRGADGALVFTENLPPAKVITEWRHDPQFPGDVRVTMTLTATKRGSFSLATPTLAYLERDELAWGMVPGNWYGTDLQRNAELSPGYSQGLPDRPTLVTETNTMTLCPLLTSKSGVTLAVIPEPGSAMDPWENDQSTRGNLRLQLSTMDRYQQLTPVVYSPILGGLGSKLEPGQTLTFSWRYTIEAAPWFSAFRHAVMDVYRFPQLLDLQSSRESLAVRLERLHAALGDDKRSLWKTKSYNGVEIGANGTKTSDVGAMWMLARTSRDPKLLARLPFLRNFKLEQQQMAPGFFQHAATGEYPGENGFEAERGNWIEPLFTTYYTLFDLGNILLFDPQDTTVRERIRLAADKLLQWQKPDGSWVVAYDRYSHREAFPHLTDLRPTWYGLLVAWRALGDDRYLAAARRGADWYVANAVQPGHFLGACGDALNVWDFTTATGAQALLGLFDATQDPRYRDAAIAVARIYATTIFTQPIPTTKEKTVAGVKRADWEITQTGLSVEHIRGTAGGGPITLSSHAGLFVRMSELTRDALFLDLARAAARGRHHFTDEITGMGTYYWNSIDRVAAVSTMFPWHAEWHVGWITDYLVSEAALRTAGQIRFPGGHPTPKVGPHVTYGFAPGKIYGRPASLWMGTGAVKCDSPNVEYLCATDAARRTVFLVALNQSPRAQSTKLRLDPQPITLEPALRTKRWQALAGAVKDAEGRDGEFVFDLAPWGIGVVAVNLE